MLKILADRVVQELIQVLNKTVFKQRESYYGGKSRTCEQSMKELFITEVKD